METAPIVQAHAAARSASTTIPGASEKHNHAAKHFASAATGVDDYEALRILNLLEKQHKQLAEIITDQATPKAKPALAAAKAEEPQPSRKSDGTAPDAAVPVSPSSRRSTSPVLHRRLARESSSSIANNLANARGIPQARRQGSSVQADAPSNGSSRASRESRRLEKDMLNDGHAGKNAPTPNATGTQPSTTDEPFQKFYSTFEGLLSKLSAPLGFAGLPLTPEEALQEAPPETPKSRQSSTILAKASTTSIPDVSRIFSKASLKAVKDDNPNFGGVHESFLVVPTGGGTVSYANILRETRRAQSSLSELDEAEEFVDAKETPSRSPKASRVVTKSKSGKTIEELEMDNKALRVMTDQLSARVYMWEQSAQAQSMAMHASVRNLKPPDMHPMPSTSSDPSRELSSPRKAGLARRPDPSQMNADEKKGSTEDRIRELEEQLRAATREIERVGRENDKLNSVVTRYRAKWDKLKEGARARRDGTAADRAGTPAAEPVA